MGLSYLKTLDISHNLIYVLPDSTQVIRQYIRHVRIRLSYGGFFKNFVLFFFRHSDQFTVPRNASGFVQRLDELVQRFPRLSHTLSRGSGIQQHNDHSRRVGRNDSMQITWSQQHAENIHGR